MVSTLPPLFLGAHWNELLVVLILVLIIFGPRQLPKIGRALGGGIKEFKDGLRTGDLGEEEPSNTDSRTTVQAHPPQPLPSEQAPASESSSAEPVEKPRESSSP